MSSAGKLPKQPGTRPARGYKWDQFKPGHTVSLHHGANSPRVVNPMAAKIAAELLADDDVAYLRAPSYQASVTAWSRAEAQVILLNDYVAKLGNIVDAIAETEESESTETHQAGYSKRTSTTKRLGSALTLLDRAERHAANLRTRLGLDPLSRARLGRDVTAMQAQGDMAKYLSQLQREQDERAAEGGGTR